MSRSKKRRTDRRSVEQPPASKAIERDRQGQGKRTGFIIAAVVIIIILIVIGISYYPTYIAPFRVTVITVDDVSIRMDYFLKRTRAAGSDPMSMLGNIAQEEIIKLEASRSGMEVRDEDIDVELRRMALGQSETISESEYREWYRQRLNEIGLSDSEYRDVIAANILATYFFEYISATMPTTAEQVHLHTILLDTEEEVDQVMARLEAGEDFADLARELSLDAISRENGGDLGWVPRNIAYESRFDSELFSLSTGNISEPLPYYDTGVEDPTSPAYVNYFIFMVSEKADSREVYEEYLPALKNKAFSDWISMQMGLYEIRYHGFNNGFDSETYAWINWQLSK